MPDSPTDPLAPFLLSRDARELVDVLLELAHEHEPVRERIERMRLAERPDRLAATFRATLNGWRRSKRFVPRGEARAFGRELEAWLDQVARELMPRDAAAALALFERFIESDALWFERADDSDAAIGGAVRAACERWLEAAARVGGDPEAWSERLVALYDGDDYGAREKLLRAADRLLDEPALRRLVQQYDERLQRTVTAGRVGGHLPHEVFTQSAALSQLAEALRDPDVAVRATLRYSPDPNPLQRQRFVRDYLDAGRPADALEWLQGSWEHHEESRQALLAETLERLERYDESVPIRRGLFGRRMSVHDFRGWIEHLPEGERADAREEALRLAQRHADPVTAASLLLEIGEHAIADAVLADGHERIDGRRYEHLGSLAKSLRERGCVRGESAVYRALLGDILGRANSRAYGHAARYWARLGRIAAAGADLAPMPAHETFAAAVRAAHGRKVGFWARVEEDETD
jgi:hypothetical protein